MYKRFLHIAVLITALLNMFAAQASEYNGRFFGGKFGVNNSQATGAIDAPSASTFAYGVQGGYFQGGYNWDVKAATIGVGAYADFNSYEKRKNGVVYGSRAYGIDAKLGLPLDDWLLYAKIGYGYSTGTGDLGAVAQKGTNHAIGVEYEFAFRWGAIIEYKIDGFSNKDGSVKIQNKTLSFGLNYYFDRKPKAKEVKVAVDLDLIPEPEMDDFDSEPIPEIGFNFDPSTPVSTDPKSWKVLLENKFVRIGSSTFVPDSVRLKSEINVELDEVAEFAAKYPDAMLELFGYSDSGGTDENIQRQSLSRAESVKEYLIKKGVAANRITTNGAGSANPIGDNKTKEGRAKNHRVEIRSVMNKEKKVPAEEPAPAPAPAPAPEPVLAPDSELDSDLLFP